MYYSYTTLWCDGSALFCLPLLIGEAGLPVQVPGSRFTFYALRFTVRPHRIAPFFVHDESSENKVPLEVNLPQWEILSGGTVRPTVERLGVFPDAFEAFRRCFREKLVPFFLDSGMDPEKLGRYSFMGSDPFLIFRSEGTRIELMHRGLRWRGVGDPFRALSELFGRLRAAPIEAAVPFTGGAVGYFGYDLCHFVETLPAAAVDDAGVPDCYLAFYDKVVAFDHLRRRAYFCSCRISGSEESESGRRDDLIRAALSVVPDSPPSEKSSGIPMEAPLPPVRSNFTKDQYLTAIRRAKAYIAAGDIYQVNLSQRFSGPLPVPPFDLYTRLRARNPAPFAAFLDFGELQVLSSSPERFLQMEARTRNVYTRPIKGTRPRGNTPERDADLGRELLLSEKDRAELVMIVDLERNDLGRVCETGSVHVPELMALERYPTVYHLVSTIAGKLSPERDRMGLLRAMFPGGSITGAPKIRAMEIIAELEPTRRGVYTGSIGWLGFTGDMDLNIAIRTFVVRDGMARFQVGGGIVADSDPEEEYEETLHKGRALMAALGSVNYKMKNEKYKM
ncbi:MAG: aminodeoxychorismate synthase component I [Candidatus Latescibacteria bacterium]|nr:aminodeoxychorismate synthase component I [Candidatus Latescibacterota bacterium]